MDAGGSGSEGSSSGEGEVDRISLPGVQGSLINAKLARSMQDNADLFYQDLQAPMIAHLAKTSDGPRRTVQYATQMPLAKQRMLGFFTWGVAHVDFVLDQGKVSEARLAVLRLLACID